MISYSRGRYKEISVITSNRHLYAVQYDTYIKVPVNINSIRKTIAIIDSGATGNFISERFALDNDLPTRTKKDQYSL